jgi:hypothetical protein
LTFTARRKKGIMQATMEISDTEVQEAVKDYLFKHGWKASSVKFTVHPYGGDQREGPDGYRVTARATVTSRSQHEPDYDPQRG